ncbi:hypothetical protein RHMOL_Rhmol03G0114500 [Rhododendron molle]|uniref:Uncharacterized protein n=2 Tax=Rhododendron molle TaxID=49168 RepID=A0ACC0PFJ6_RHOML|nr:hypothetical protein RHMOL_Rhmol03G0114500 [Rhododendron molle]KAI8563488.1 hypothetical protein RHMOL_Rhmol03G0114500 [Rhododendron molle]
MQNSPNQGDPDQDQRKNAGMEESTIEFLRARLLSERSVSKTARQRADELAKRVLELEEELKIVSLQRKKAEKAAADVLAILENNGISEFSDEFDSTSEQDVIHCESKAGHSPEEEDSSVDSRMQRNHTDELSSSELESSPLPGRRLSWKGCKDCSHSREKKYMDSPIRRRNSSVSTTSASPRCRVGKSCRQIRRRETSNEFSCYVNIYILAAPRFSNMLCGWVVRSATEESQCDNIMLSPQQNGVATFSEGLPSRSDTRAEILREGAEQDANICLGTPVSGDIENQRMVANGSNYLNTRGSGKDMELALAHQAQLIGQYEEEEKAQREWEEKFRENYSNTPDSCEPGNHSDVTEERDEPKDDAPPDHVGTTALLDQEAKSKVEDICVTKKSSESQPNGFQSPPQVDLGCFQGRKSQPSDVGFPVATGIRNQQPSTGNLSVPPSPSYHHRSHLEGPTGSQSPQIVPSESKNEQYALIPHETPDKLGSVLEALHQAKLSLKHSANNAIPPIGSSSVGNAIEFSVGDRRPEVPTGCPGLFRVPSDFDLEATAKSNFPGSNSRLSLTNHYPDPGNTLTAVDLFTTPFTTPFTVSTSSISTGNRNHSVSINPYIESRSRIPDSPETWSRFPYYNPLPGPSLGAGLPLSRRYAYTDPNADAAALVSSSTFISPVYPYPDLMPSDERQRLFSSMGAGIPPPNRFSFSNDIIRPNNMSSIAFSFPDVMPRIPSEERSRLFLSSGPGIPSQNRFTLENGHIPSEERSRLFSSRGPGIPSQNRFALEKGHIPSEERSRFSSSGPGIPSQNQFALENDHLRRNMYR